MQLFIQVLNTSPVKREKTGCDATNIYIILTEWLYEVAGHPV